MLKQKICIKKTNTFTIATNFVQEQLNITDWPEELISYNSEELLSNGYYIPL